MYDWAYSLNGENWNVVQSVDFKREAFLNLPPVPLVVNQENSRSIIDRRYLSELNRKKGRCPKNNIFKRLTKLGQIFIWYKNQTHRHVRRRTHVSENTDSVSGGLKIVTEPAKGYDWNWILYGYCATFGKTKVIVPKLSVPINFKKVSHYIFTK